MHPDVYRQYDNRAVLDPPGFDDAVEAAFDALSRTCLQNVLMLYEELALNEPDMAEACGLMDDRYEVYAMKIGQCPSHRLAVSVDRSGENPPPVIVHGPVPTRRACEGARRLTRLHRALIDPVWEPYE